MIRIQLTLMLHILIFTIVPWLAVNVMEEDFALTVEDGTYIADGPNTVAISPASAGTDDTLPSFSTSYTSTEYTSVHRGPLEEGCKDMLTGVSNDLQTTLQYVTPVSVSVRYTKHPLASEPVLKRHTSPMGDKVLAETPTTSNVTTRKGCVYMINIQQCLL